MTDDELAELAHDIKANGLLHPTVLDADVVVDGRNPFVHARAGVEPHFVQLNGQDARALIVSANIARRHLTKAQQAIALAMIYPEPDQRGRGKKSEATKYAESRVFGRCCKTPDASFTTPLNWRGTFYTGVGTSMKC